MYLATQDIVASQVGQVLVVKMVLQAIQVGQASQDKMVLQVLAV